MKLESKNKTEFLAVGKACKAILWATFDSSDVSSCLGVKRLSSSNNTSVFEGGNLHCNVILKIIIQLFYIILQLIVVHHCTKSGLSVQMIYMCRHVWQQCIIKIAGVSCCFIPSLTLTFQNCCCYFPLSWWHAQSVWWEQKVPVPASRQTCSWSCPGSDQSQCGTTDQ